MAHILRHDGLLHEIIEKRMKGEPRRGRDCNLQMLYDLKKVTVMLQSNERLKKGWDRDTEECCQKPASKQKSNRPTETADPKI